MNERLSFSVKYFDEISNVIKRLDRDNLEKLVDNLVKVKNKGRIFFLGLVEVQETALML